MQMACYHFGHFCLQKKRNTPFEYSKDREAGVAASNDQRLLRKSDAIRLEAAYVHYSFQSRYKHRSINEQSVVKVLPGTELTVYVSFP
jgi:hypothetical protein